MISLLLLHCDGNKTVACNVLLVGGLIIILTQDVFMPDSLSKQSALVTASGERGKIVFADYEDNGSSGIICNECGWK